MFEDDLKSMMQRKFRLGVLVGMSLATALLAFALYLSSVIYV